MSFSEAPIISISFFCGIRIQSCRAYEEQTLLMEDTQFVFLAIPASTSHLAASCMLENSRKTSPDTKSTIETDLLDLAAEALPLFFALA